MLRPEARSADWSTLNHGQQDAFLKILDMFSAALGDLPEARAHVGGPGAETTLGMGHSNRIVFLDGDRGTGKSTVLASLIDAERQEFPNNVQARVEPVRNRLVWLEPLDLEPVSESINLLAAILVRIDYAMRHLGRPSQASRYGDDVRREGFGLLGPDVEARDPMMELQRLQSDATLAWDGNLGQRRGSLDADAYAVEVLRTENARLRVNVHFHGVLEQTARALHERTRFDNPLFVLPVDDFDLNPAVCLDLLRLLRMVSVPRLFTLVLGDLRVAEMVLRLKLSRDFGQAGQDHIALPMHPDEIAATIADVAANASRKLLPPTQRVGLQATSLVEALNFRPLGLKDDAKRLFQILAKVPLPQGQVKIFGKNVKHLCDFLLTKGGSTKGTSFNKKKLTEKDTDGSAYSARQLLAAPPRRLTDLWIALHKLPENETRIVDFFAHYSAKLLGQDTTLSPTARREAQQSIRHGSDGLWEIGRAPSLDIRPNVELTLAVRGLEIQAHVPDSVLRSTIRLSKHLNWQFHEGESNLSPESASALCLLHDLLALECGKNFSSPLLGGKMFTGWAVSEWSEGAETLGTIPWPTPPCVMFWELDLFFVRWNDFLRQRSQRLRESPYAASTEFDEAVFGWIDAGSAILDGENPLTWNGNWDDLRQRLDSLSARAKGDRVANLRIVDWLAKVAAFLMPDGGLDKRFVLGNLTWAVPFADEFCSACTNRLRQVGPLLAGALLKSLPESPPGDGPPLINVYREVLKKVASGTGTSRPSS